MSKYRALFFSIIFLVFGFFPIHADPIIDHTCTDLGSIPQPWLQAAKDSRHIAYGHTSHGSQLTDGMTGLVGFINNHGLGLDFPNNFFAWNNGGTGGALDIRDYAMGGIDVGSYPAWVNNTRTYLGDPNAEGRGTNNPDVNVIIWSWCGQVPDKYAAGTLYTEYLNPMAQLEIDYSGVTFVYMTGHVDHWKDAHTKAGNQIIREFCAGNKRILYDFADIESWDPHGVFYEFPNDTCDYYASVNGALLGNWATEWQANHTIDLDWYNCGAAHTQPLNANRKAYAAWWLWARLAGWDGSSGTTPYTIRGTITYNGSALAGVALNDLPDSPITNALGQYAATVNSGWSGTGTPSKAGYSFTPSHYEYTNVGADQTDRNFTAGTTPYIISGIVTYNGSALADVVMNGLPGNPATGDFGEYSIEVHSAWSGTVRPTLSGYTFTPAEQAYAIGLTTDQTRDYTASASCSESDPSAEGEGGGGGGCFIAAAGDGSPAVKAFGSPPGALLLMIMVLAGMFLNRKRRFRLELIFNATK